MRFKLFDIKTALSCLRAGRAIICPSESSYSLSCDARSEMAVEEIRRVKKDQKFKPMTILVSDLKMVEEFGILSDKAREIVGRLMPGQLNLIIEKRDEKGFNWLSRQGEGIAFRIPNNNIMLDLIKGLGWPITTTSANLHGKPSLYKIEEVKMLFSEDVCCIIDAGDLDESISVSTVYDTRTGRVLREGPIKEWEIL